MYDVRLTPAGLLENHLDIPKDSSLDDIYPYPPLNNILSASSILAVSGSEFI